MRPIKISIFGADGLTCQMPRIKEAMQSLGHILSNNSPDLIYSNDPTGYEKAMLLKKKFPNSKFKIGMFQLGLSPEFPIPKFVLRILPSFNKFFTRSEQSRND